jgi:hypothetical protein
MSPTLQCFICTLPISRFDVVNNHHVTYKSQGGTETRPTHRECHVRLHSSRNDFREWGRIGGLISALSRQWAFNLKNVRNDPAHEINRDFYRAMYAH